MNPLFKALPTDRLPHGWQVLATLLAGGAVFTLCWYLSQKGLLDIAATGLSFFIFTLIRQLGTSLTSRAPSEFAKSASMIDAFRADLAAWSANRKMLTHVLIAFGATLLFLAGRAIASTVMVLIASPWLALALGLMVAAAVASPVLVKGIADSIKTRKSADT